MMMGIIAAIVASFCASVWIFALLATLILQFAGLEKM
jgi:hypothetical protein